MPEGCGTWPAAWETLESDWPNSGEVDIVEGVNNETPNQSTLHTSAGCTMPGGGAMTGFVHSTFPLPAPLLNRLLPILHLNVLSIFFYYPGLSRAQTATQQMTVMQAAE